MKFDLDSAKTTVPDEASVTEGRAESAVGAIKFQSATLVAPQAAPTNSLDPLAGAGVALTKYVLMILSGVLLLLMITLMYQEVSFSIWTAKAYRSEIDIPVVTPPINSQQAQGGAVLLMLQSAETATTPLAARLSLKSAAEKLNQYVNSASANGASMGKLAQDIQTLATHSPAQPIDAKKLHDILDRADALLVVTTVPPGAADQLKARQDLLKTYLDATNATRDFWARIAQMILLNLLLPVLTALLGYVFASKQSK